MCLELSDLWRNGESCHLTLDKVGMTTREEMSDNYWTILGLKVSIFTLLEVTDYKNNFSKFLPVSKKRPSVDSEEPEVQIRFH